MKTRSELVTEFRQWIDQPNTAIITPTMANYEINKAYRELIALINSWNEKFYLTSGTVTTTVSVQYVSVPTDCIMVKRLVDSSGYTLPHKNLDQFDYSLANAEPAFWDSAGRYIRFSPTPNASTYVYTIYYTKMPSELSGDSSTPEFVPGYEGLIALKAAINSKTIRDESTRELAQLAYFEELKALRHVVVTQYTGGGSRILDSEYELEN